MKVTANRTLPNFSEATLTITNTGTGPLNFRLLLPSPVRTLDSSALGLRRPPATVAPRLASRTQYRRESLGACGWCSFPPFLVLQQRT
jgi:hypothetical protein